ncbi:MAG: rRNA maturation RNase YbeY [Acidocella sp.]|nr:rRNA maturation RNase YbeY [Acidocella sp.]
MPPPGSTRANAALEIMKMPEGGIVITDRRWRRCVRDVERKITRAMRAAGCAADVVLTDDRTIRRLNYHHRGRNKPTNVLTYEHPAEILLGFGVVQREAAAAGRSVAAHLAHLLIHGALHLQGFDHHHAGDARRMEGQEARLLSRLRIANPWKNR